MRYVPLSHQHLVGENPFLHPMFYRINRLFRVNNYVYQYASLVLSICKVKDD